MKLQRWQKQILEKSLEVDPETGKFKARRMVIRLPRRRSAPTSAPSSDEPASQEP